MKVKELKFLLKLVGRENYQGKISELKPNTKTKISETEGICRDLCDYQYVACSEEITKIKINSAGKALLKLNSDELPVSADELKILKACATETITPGKTKVTPPEKRQELIASLVERGLIIAAAATKIERVWLTERGKEFLAKEYDPKGTNSVLSLDLLSNYLRFSRKYFGSYQSVSPSTANDKPNNNGKKPSDEEILQTIIDLDRELGTDNYLPIFHLRNKLQPPLSRQELDDALYRLQRQDKLELSSLVEAVHYTKEQIEAGITQDVGGSLFFLMVN
ncbi:hypothetical protein IQ238_07995 [Pleurocapsales cyanobacterium LEGE 06147]|nr:hypothetical protein [Pleurocapsales cyanobacterium LEGE 06147]